MLAQIRAYTARLHQEVIGNSVQNGGTESYRRERERAFCGDCNKVERRAFAEEEPGARREECGQECRTAYARKRPFPFKRDIQPIVPLREETLERAR